MSTERSINQTTLFARLKATRFVLLAYQNYTFNVVSSSTSIVKYGNCSSDSLSSNWSAIGANLLDPSGQARLIFVSSATGTSTTAAQLCPVLKALHLSDALRLDGGPSASMSYNGQLLNPLSGLYRIKYGLARHVAYVLRAGQ